MALRLNLAWGGWGEEVFSLPTHGARPLLFLPRCPPSQGAALSYPAHEYPPPDFRAWAPVMVSRPVLPAVFLALPPGVLVKFIPRLQPESDGPGGSSGKESCLLV